jgi:phosphate transport system substrate-binding protein
MRLKTLVATAIALLALAVPASAGAVTLIGSGSVAAQPVLQALFTTYTKQVNHKVHFVYTANGGNAGVKDVQNGTSQFAGQARTPLPSDAGTTYVKMFLDGLCIDVNPKNKLSDISIQQVHDIYRGLLTNWNQLPGSGLETTIDPVGRDTNGGTYNFFLQAVLNNELPSSNVNALTADGLVVNAVKQDPSAIGYDGLAWQGKGQKALKVNGVPCVASKISVEPLKYPLSRYLFLVLPTGEANPALAKFIDWARRDPLAGEVIAKAGGVPAFNKKAKRK